MEQFGAGRQKSVIHRGYFKIADHLAKTARGLGLDLFDLIGRRCVSRRGVGGKGGNQQSGGKKCGEFFMVLSLFKIKGMGFQTAFQAALAGGSLKAPKFTPQNAASRFR